MQTKKKIYICAIVAVLGLLLMGISINWTFNEFQILQYSIQQFKAQYSYINYLWMQTILYLGVIMLFSGIFTGFYFSREYIYEDKNTALLPILKDRVSDEVS